MLGTLVMEVYIGPAFLKGNWTICIWNFKLRHTFRFSISISRNLAKENYLSNGQVKRKNLLIVASFIIWNACYDGVIFAELW